MKIRKIKKGSSSIDPDYQIANSEVVDKGKTCYAAPDFKSPPDPDGSGGLSDSFLFRLCSSSLCFKMWHSSNFLHFCCLTKNSSTNCTSYRGKAGKVPNSVTSMQ